MEEEVAVKETEVEPEILTSVLELDLSGRATNEGREIVRLDMKAMPSNFSDMLKLRIIKSLIQIAWVNLKEDVKVYDEYEQVISEDEDIVDFFLMSGKINMEPDDRKVKKIALSNNVIKMVRRHGMRAFNNPAIQEVIRTVLGEGGKAAGELLAGIDKAWFSNAHAKRSPGKPRNLKIEAIGIERLKRRHKQITGVLHFLKNENKGSGHLKPDSDVEGLVYSARRDFFQKEGIDLSIDDPDGPHLDAWNPIYRILKDDPEIRSEFLTLTWEPAKMSKRIIAKLLDAGIETIERLL